MRIERVEIEQFGDLIGRRIDIPDSGLIVFYGQNEAGKTTLRQFVHHTLFGYPRKSKTSYESQNELPAAGSLHLRTKDDATIIISRKNSGRGEPEIVRNGNLLRGEGVLQGYIGDIPEAVFSIVYAIDISLLHDHKTMQTDELRGVLFGAGAGVGNPMKIKGLFKNEKDALYLKTARTDTRKLHAAAGELRELDRQIKDAQNQIGEYDNLVGQLRQGEWTVQELRGKQRSCIERLQRVKNLSSVYKEFVAWRQAQEQLDRLADVDDLPESVIAEVERLLAAIDERAKALAELEKSIISNQSKYETIVVDESLIAIRKRIEVLKSQHGSYKDAVNDLPGVEIKRDTLAAHILDDIRSINSDWTDSDIAGFSLDAVDRQELEDYGNRFRSMRHRLEMAESRAQQARQDGAEKPPSASLNIWIVRAIALISFIGAVSGVLLSNWLLFGFALALFIVSGFLLFGRRENSNVPAHDAVGEEMTVVKKELDVLRTEWSPVVERFGFDCSYEPDTVKECVAKIESVKKDIERLSDDDLRIARMKEKIESVDSNYESLLEELGEPTSDAQFLTGIAVLDDRLQKNITEKARRDEIRQQFDEAVRKKELMREQQTQDAEALQKSLRVHGLNSIDEYRKRLESCTKKTELDELIADSENRIQLIVGIGEKFKDALIKLNTKAPDELEQDVHDLEAEIAGVDAEIEVANQRIGTLNTKIADLRSREDISIMMQNRASHRERFNRLVEQYIIAHAAEFVLDKAVADYEKNRQPAVIRSAERYFSALTCGRYTHLIQSLETDDILVDDGHGRRKSVYILSRGTLEQLYLALRLAAIEEFEQHSEPMPFIVDDLLVNFDDERRAATSEVLVEFAKDRQVLVLTCHEETRDRFEKLGGTCVKWAS